MPATTLRVSVLCLLLGVAATGLAAVDRQASQSFYEDAVERFRAQNFPEAEIQLRNALQRDPNNLAARILFGKTLMFMGEGHAAIHEFKRARTLGGDENLFVVALARAYLSIAEPEEVISQFRPQNYSESVAGELFLVIADAHMQLGNLEGARTAYAESAARLTLDARPVLGRARIALAEGKQAEAAKLLKTAIVLGPDDPAAWLLKAIMHRDSGEFPEARAAFERTLALEPESIRALVGRTAMWMDLGETANAREDLERARALGTGTLEFIYLDALLLFQEGKAEEARESLRARAAEIEDIRQDVRAKLPQVELMLGVVAYFERNHLQAVEHLRRFLAVNPSHRGGRRYLAGAYLALREYDEVIDLYRPTSKSPAPRDPLALAMLAEAYRGKGEYAEAENAIASAYRMGPALASVGVRVAMDRLGSGRADKAVVDLEKLAARFPRFVEIQAQLARAYVAVGDLDKAKAVTDELVAKSPDDSRTAVLAGSVQVALGDLAGAREQFMRAAAVDRRLLLPRVNLARIEQLQGNGQEAERRYREILDEFPAHAASSIALARLLMARGDLRAAEAYVEAVVAANPDLVDAHAVNIELMMASGASVADVTAALERALAQFGDRPEVHLLAVRVYRRLGATAKVVEHLRSAAKAESGAVTPLFAIARQQFGMGDFEGARDTLARAGRTDPDHLGVLVLRASVASTLKQYGVAESFISRAEGLYGEKASILTVKGDWYMAQSRPAEAVESYQRAFDISPNTRTVITLFRARTAAGQAAEALALMEQWLTANPDDLESRRIHTRLLVREREWEKARSSYEALMQAGVKDAILLNNLAVVYQHLADPRALETAREAHERAPESASILDTYGWLLSENGDPKKGLALLRDAYSRLSTEPAIRYHIGLALSRIPGREVEAAEELKAAISQQPGPAVWKEDAREVLQALGKAN